ncbi:MAG TPA: hypothetical protein VHT91_02115 [Kofleriaceae bacterium]|jgi:hypothetical protein|nr:hypothetical protein [Kofleriaceae bacterium]
MASNTTDPVVVEADRRVEQAKASLRARMAVLERRLGDVRDRIDLPAQIRRHPLPAVGIAFALGALVGARGRAAGRSPPPVAPVLVARPRTLGSMALAIVSGLAFQLLRELAIGQLRRTAERYWSEPGESFDDPGPAYGMAPDTES